MNGIGKAAWSGFKAIENGLLGKRRDDNYKELVQNMLKSYEALGINKIIYDQHYQPSTFKVGDKVWLQTFYHPDNRNLMPPMFGPFTILKQISPVNYEIDKPQSNLGKTTMVIHSSKLRPYYPKEGFELKLTKVKYPL
ncbi:K02A2.6-like [Cordylochernes scorpioides]|uniref:K02A2.6-like n=1 Tax=Cordylochernes scorpioides TaxID=51811 RepID=A0ABY6K644_9ARAC|nr:K02A2.6-like [Cordylochernes scorpioides]